MLHRLILSFSLVLLFALAQQGAAIHAISHYADVAPLSQQQDQSPHAPVCDECLSYGELASALGVAYFNVPLAATGFEPFSYHTNSHFSTALPSYSARAPPLFA